MHYPGSLAEEIRVLVYKVSNGTNSPSYTLLYRQNFWRVWSFCVKNTLPLAGWGHYNCFLKWPLLSNHCKLCLIKLSLGRFRIHSDIFFNEGFEQVLSTFLQVQSCIWSLVSHAGKAKMDFLKGNHILALGLAENHLLSTLYKVIGLYSLMFLGLYLGSSYRPWYPATPQWLWGFLGKQ